MAARGSTVLQYQSGEVAVEAVSITGKNGLRVDTVLSSGAYEVPVYFSAKGTQVGLFRASDDKQLWGGKLLSTGQVVTVTGALVDPDATGESFVDIRTQFDAESDTSNTTLRLMGVSFDGAPDPDPDNPSLTPDPVGSAAMVTIGADTSPAWDGSTYVDEVYGFLRGKGDFTVGAESVLRLTGGNGTTVEGCAFQPGPAVNERDTLELYANFVPLDSGTCNLGGAKRWRRLYCTLSVDVSSDARLKKDIEDLPGDLIFRLRPRAYRLTQEPERVHYGLIAQEVQAALEAMGISDAGFFGDENPECLSLRYEELIAPLIAAAQALEKRIGRLEGRLHE